MSNKKIFKKLYSKKINKDDNYKEIIRRIENNNKKYSMYKKILVPVCSLVLVFWLISINVNEKGDSFNSNIDMNKDFDLYINNNSNNSVTSTFSSDYMYDIDDYKKVDIDYEKLIQLSDYSFLVDLNIPNDLENRKYSEVYVKENKNSGDNILQNYELIFKDNNDRNVIILISNEYEINNNEINKDNIKISNINDTQVIVYQDGIMYIVNFIYNNKYFNIVTNNIDEEELINILVSIIK